MRTYFVLALLTLLAGCGHTETPTERGCRIVREPMSPEGAARFDAIWGPDVRHSAAYLAAKAADTTDPMCGHGDAVFDLLHPGYRASPEYAKQLQDIKDFGDRLDAMHEQEMYNIWEIRHVCELRPWLSTCQ